MQRGMRTQTNNPRTNLGATSTSKPPTFIPLVLADPNDTRVSAAVAVSIGACFRALDMAEVTAVVLRGAFTHIVRRVRCRMPYAHRVAGHVKFRDAKSAGDVSNCAIQVGGDVDGSGVPCASCTASSLIV